MNQLCSDLISIGESKTNGLGYLFAAGLTSFGFWLLFSLSAGAFYEKLQIIVWNLEKCPTSKPFELLTYWYYRCSLHVWIVESAQLDLLMAWHVLSPPLEEVGPLMQSAQISELHSDYSHFGLSSLCQLELFVWEKLQIISWNMEKWRTLKPFELLTYW